MSYQKKLYIGQYLLINEQFEDIGAAGVTRTGGVIEARVTGVVRGTGAVGAMRACRATGEGRYRCCGTLEFLLIGNYLAKLRAPC